jgi:hypothetical protein
VKKAIIKEPLQIEALKRHTIRKSLANKVITPVSVASLFEKTTDSGDDPLHDLIAQPRSPYSLSSFRQPLIT